MQRNEGPPSAAQGGQNSNDEVYYYSILGHVLVYSKTSYHALVYCGTSHQCWYIMYHPKVCTGIFWAKI